jgi:glycogen(starch) synthase
MSIHVLQLGPYPPPEGGVSRNMLAIRDRLVDDGDHCSIIATTRSTTIVDEPDVYHPRSATELISQIRRLTFDILHLHLGGEIGPRVLGLAFACSLLAKGSCVLTMHSGGFAQGNRSGKFGTGKFSNAVFRKFSRVIAVNDELAAIFRKTGIDNAHIRVIAPFSPSAPDQEVKVPEEFRKFIESHSPFLLAVGGLEPEYDPIFQVNTMKSVLRKYPECGLMIVGDGSIKKDVTRTIRDLGLDASVLLAGNVDHSITLHLIRSANVLLRTTLFDGDAISIREALFLGTGVIATDVGQRPAGVHLIPAGDGEALIQKLDEVLTSQAQPSPPESVNDENIRSVIDLYRELLSRG